MASSSKTITQKDKDNFLKAYKKSLGNVSTACKFAGFARNTFYLNKSKDKDFREQVDEIDDYVGDFVESKLVARINANDTTGIIFYCKTKLRHRGYIEKVENQHSGDPNNPIHTVNKTELNIKSYKEARKEILDEV